MNVDAHIAGTVYRIDAPAGTRVAAGDPVVTLESMKMEVPVEAPCAGVVGELHCAVGDSVAEDQRLAVIDPAG